MASRDYFDIKVKCSNCEKSGTGHASEKDYQFMRNPDFKVKLPEGFTIKEESNTRERTLVSCACGNEFYL